MLHQTISNINFATKKIVITCVLVINSYHGRWFYSPIHTHTQRKAPLMKFLKSQQAWPPYPGNPFSVKIIQCNCKVQIETKQHAKFQFCCHCRTMNNSFILVCCPQSVILDSYKKPYPQIETVLFYLGDYHEFKHGRYNAIFEISTISGNI